MVTAKKKKGQQRKAAKTNKNNVLIATITAGIRKAEHAATELLSFSPSISNPNENAADVFINVLSSVLNFLKRCEHESFELVVARVGGDLVSPSMWINVLLFGAMHVELCRVQIAQNIGPLVKCMCNDMERLFFKSNNHWREGIVPFAKLIAVISVGCSIHEKVEFVAVDTLLKYDGLLQSIVQWNFWKEEYRPDIVKEISEASIESVRVMGNSFIHGVVCDTNYLRDGTGVVTEEGRTLMDLIGTTPIVSKDYDPNCKVTFVEGYIRHSKKKEVKEEGYWKEDLHLIGTLTINADCVDKGVLSEIIDLGLRYSSDCQTACFAASMLLIMLYEPNYGGSRMLSDTRVSFVIRAGLVEMCLGFIERFGVDNTLYGVIHDTLKCIYSISLHTKSAKAIRSKRQDIEKKLDSTIMNSTKSNIEKLFRLSEEKGDPSFVHTMLDMRKNNGTCAPHRKIKKLLDIVRSMLDISGRFCCRCNKSLSKTEVMECNGCGRVSYCSRACQKDDWLNGHKLTCNKQCTHENIGKFQGMLQPSLLLENERAATKLKELEINFTMVQLNMFLDHSDTILSQAKSLGIPLHDCIAVFDLRGCPMKVETFSYTHDKSVFSCCDLWLQ